MDSTGILEQQAIDAAIANNWENAIEINNRIISADEKNLAAILRLGYAYLQSGRAKEAEAAYKKALTLQPKNQIAMQNLERAKFLAGQKGDKNSVGEKKNLDPSLFLDVPGKTKTVQLVNLGQKSHLAELSIGHELELKVKKRKIEVRTLSGNYIGALPDDVSKRIIYFIEEGSIYKTYTKEASLTKITVFIKEFSKGATVENFISFPQSTQPMYHPLHEEENASTDTEDDGDIDDQNDSELDYEDESKEDMLRIKQQSEDADDTDDE